MSRFSPPPPAVLVDQDHPILLSSAIRECKTRGGLDTVGVAFGDAIVPRVLASTRAEHSAALADEVARIRVDVGDCRVPWWSKVLVCVCAVCVN